MKESAAWLLKSLMVFWVLNAIPGSLVLFFSLLISPPLGLMVLIYGIFAVAVLVGWMRWSGSGKRSPGSWLLLPASLALWVIPILSFAWLCEFISTPSTPGELGPDQPGDWTLFEFVLIPLIWFAAPLTLTIQLWWVCNWREN